ncbi:oligopeptide ABC transporter ATP-binding protein [Gottschalkia acidurici 9a]|uniref:Oligopeptide ABC transporter ATP-binding protein n=1 Tax=Gottschalkia acidurici (strain ATCC 7906 / DSM 604 / BCRC 14475 / CIP 104303 / KCTC 5404 / NCIMB 10678 / 9a) TaxID=1128398 RepID=K0AWC3_GOTA9|nr:dipeptide ABC transporter ATP-binding protein [Gottschalkia acidurici]AFS78153.1 oligopeptide ABC transporter ATP-binding protein [Gottschalkia acidurici 9a]
MEKNKKILLSVKNLEKHFLSNESNILGLLSKKNKVSAVNGVSLDLYENETYGLVGESGCGKSTLARIIVNLIRPFSGEILYNGKNLLNLNDRELKSIRRDLQMVFQDPFSSLNPKKRIGKMLEEPLIIHNVDNKEGRQEKVFEILEKVGLKASHYYNYPHEFSGGQRQRVSLARSLILNPKIMVCDEPVSALDVSIQAQIINLLKSLQKEFGLTYLFISHDISVIRYISDRVGVMYLGKLVEEASVDELFNNPKHPYTMALFSSVPRIGKQHIKSEMKITGEIPSPLNLPKGCVFHTRCPNAIDICKEKSPEFIEKDNGHKVACFLLD